MRLTRKHTIWVMVTLVILALAWELLALVKGDGATISEMVWSVTSPLLPFAMGMLMGHFFFTKGKCVHCGKYPYRR